MKFLKYTVLLGILILLNSCSDYLSELPDNRTEIDSAEKIKEVLVAAYPSASYMAFLEPMTDNAADKGNLSLTTDLNLKSYSWDVVIGDQQDTPIYFWDQSYKAIAQANQAIASVEEIEAKNNVDDVSRLNSLKGEGLISRAYNHFMLVNMWGEHYNPQTAGSDLGVPYVLEPETKILTEYPRNTVQEVYDFIENDIEEGLELLENDYAEPKYHFTVEAAKAFAVRFYLFRGDESKGDWDKVLEYSNDILNNPETKMRDWNAYANLQYDELKNIYTSPQETSNLLIISPRSRWGFNDFAAARFGLSIKKKDELFEDSATPYGKEWSYRIFGTTFYNNIPKFQDYFKYVNLNAGTGFRVTTEALITYDEVMLARAEAKVMKNNFDGALEDLDIFLAGKTKGIDSSDKISDTYATSTYPNAINDYNPYYTLTAEQASYIKMIAEFRRRQFYHEGMRWFDIKRYHIELTHEFRDSEKLTLAGDDPRRLLQIPPNAVALGMKPNAR